MKFFRKILLPALLLLSLAGPGVPAKAGEDAHAMSRAALFIVHREGYRLPCRQGARAVLRCWLGSIDAHRGRKHTVEREFGRASGERCGTIVA